MSTETAAPVPYHRLATLRPEWSRWWRPLFTIFVTVMAYLVLVSLLMVGSVLVLTLFGANRSIGRHLGDPTSPLDVFLQCAFSALLIPSALLGVRLGGWRPLTLLWSVAGGFRTDLIRRAAAPVLIVFALVAGLELVIGHDHASVPPIGRALSVIVLLLLLVPLQAIGEELAFRGVGQQAFGTWLRSPVWAIVLPVPFELIGRGYGPWEMVTAAVLGLACGHLAWKTGGLELPILLHLAVTGMTSLAALFGGPASPSGALMIAAIIATTLVLAQRTDARESLSTVQAVQRPAGSPIPRAVRV